MGLEPLKMFSVYQLVTERTKLLYHTLALCEKRWFAYLFLRLFNIYKDRKFKEEKQIIYVIDNLCELKMNFYYYHFVQ